MCTFERGARTGVGMQFTNTSLIEVHSCTDKLIMDTVYTMNANELSYWGEDDDGESIG